MINQRRLQTPDLRRMRGRYPVATVYIRKEDEETWLAARRLAVEKRVTISSLVSVALYEYLRRLES